ncbi:uncharacterized protein BCR38DRAFT_522171 [Pseudomassariella vexata]|uniref:Uncharacterized protein n=1 Tax=Pseudomassariella vexata TaxID=1141098 RepID=A0A1Y2E6P2_9PEZI|nr:uncharacterized protein BCR38DRAFT_522171 [Pseudomassariella vexata]ORY67179.1 hypothetical protein BCR38DRAFT_522171 [Pseudomassariella vexata]
MKEVREAAGKDATAEEDSPLKPPYSVLGEPIKIGIILAASFAAIISPVSSNIYFHALNLLAFGLQVSMPLINLTITTYFILKGLAPSFNGNFSSSNGCRPATLSVSSSAMSSTSVWLCNTTTLLSWLFTAFTELQ